MASTNELTGGSFQEANGTTLANGWLIMELNQDAQANGNTQVASGIQIKITLDGSGNVTTGFPQSVWPNDALTPAGTFYYVSAYNSSGQQVWGPHIQQVLSTPSPFNVGAWVLNSIG